jgi:hypothetical protein
VFRSLQKTNNLNNFRQLLGVVVPGMTFVWKTMKRIQTIQNIHQLIAYEAPSVIRGKLV